MLLRRLAIFLFAAIALLGCASRPPSATIDYERLVLLDAEDLAEAGIGEAYEALLPELRKYVRRPSTINESFDPEVPRYSIMVDGDEHVIYLPNSGQTQSEIWGAATFVFFKVVNDQLTDSPVRFYAIGGGNELSGAFLTPAQASAAQLELPRPSDWPYLPTAVWPRYGQHP